MSDWTDFGQANFCLASIVSERKRIFPIFSGLRHNVTIAEFHGHRLAGLEKARRVIGCLA